MRKWREDLRQSLISINAKPKQVLTTFDKQNKTSLTVEQCIYPIIRLEFFFFFFAEIKSTSDKPFLDKKQRQQLDVLLTCTNISRPFSFSTSIQVPCPILWISVTKCKKNIRNSLLEQNRRGNRNNSSSGEEVEMFFSLSYVRQTRTGQSVILRHVWQRQSGYKTGWVNTDNELWSWRSLLHIKGLRISCSIFTGLLWMFIEKILHYF